MPKNTIRGGLRLGFGPKGFQLHGVDVSFGKKPKKGKKKKKKEAGPQPLFKHEIDMLEAACERASWDTDRTPLVRAAAKNRTIRCRDLARVLGTFSWDKGRIEAAREFKGRVTDPANLASVGEAMTFSSGEREVIQALMP